MIEKLQIYKDTYLLTSKLYAAFPQMYVDADFGRIILRKKYNDREKIRKEIINNQQLNKRKSNGKAKTN